MTTKFFLSTTILLTVMLLTAGFIINNIQKNNSPAERANDQGFAVVELFTSEGCSSCPPADALLAELKNSMSAQPVFLLAFHVDYWNYLGWKDQFSDAAFSKRQQEYSSKLNAEVYTPQMIVNGKNAFVGSSSSQAKAFIETALSIPSDKKISFQNGYDENSKKVRIHFNISDASKDEVLNIALLEKEAMSNVSRGENSGKKLSHVNVVRSFSTVPSSGDGSAEISFPTELLNKSVTIICYTQNKNSLIITAASSQDIFLGTE